MPVGRFEDCKELATYALGVTGALGVPGPGGWTPQVRLDLTERLVMPGNGWTQVAELHRSPRHGAPQQVRVALVVGSEWPGAPVWLWRSDPDGGEDLQLVRETSVAQQQPYGGPLPLLLRHAALELGVLAVPAAAGDAAA